MYKKCIKCGRPLTDPVSMQRGYGPECWDKVEGAKASSSHAQTMPGQLSIDDLEGEWMSNREKRNPEGYMDTTPYQAIRSAQAKMRAQVYRSDYTKRDHDADNYVKIVKMIAEAYGFHLMERIKFEDLSTGKKYV